MNSEPVIYSLPEISSYQQYKINIILGLHRKINKDPIKDPYQSPKRDLMCSQCGQDLWWCVCHLNIINE